MPWAKVPGLLLRSPHRRYPRVSYFIHPRIDACTLICNVNNYITSCISSNAQFIKQHHQHNSVNQAHFVRILICYIYYTFSAVPSQQPILIVGGEHNILAALANDILSDPVELYSTPSVNDVITGKKNTVVIYLILKIKKL